MTNSAVTLEWFLQNDPEFTNLPNHKFIQWLKSLDTLSDANLKKMLFHMEYDFDKKFRSWGLGNNSELYRRASNSTRIPQYQCYLNRLYRIEERRWAIRLNRIKQYFGASQYDYWQILWHKNQVADVLIVPVDRNEFHYQVESLVTTLQSLLVVYDKVKTILAKGPVDVDAMKFMSNITQSSPEYLVAAILSEISRSTGLALPRLY